MQPSLSELTSNPSLPLKALSRVAEQVGFSRSSRQFSRGAQPRARRGGRPTPPVPPPAGTEPPRLRSPGSGRAGAAAGGAAERGAHAPPAAALPRLLPPARDRRRGRDRPFLRARGRAAERGGRQCRAVQHRAAGQRPVPRRGAQGSAAGAPRAAAPSPGRARPAGPGGRRMFLRLAVAVQVLLLLASRVHGFPKPAGQGKRLR